MAYYRKTAAVFLLIITLILPLFLEKEELTGVVELNRVNEESRYINKLINQKMDSTEQLTAEEREELEGEVTALIKTAVAEVVQKKNYTAVIFKTPLYRGGEDITESIIFEIDQKYD